MNGVENAPSCDLARLRWLREHGHHAGEPPTLGCCRARWIFRSLYSLAEPEIDSLATVVTDNGWISKDDGDLLTHCLLEAVANAIDHGHRFRPQADIEVTLWLDGEWWHVQVLDQGPGFARELIPMNLVEDAGRGRGMLIISAWFDRLNYWLGGRCAVMSRRLRH